MSANRLLDLGSFVLEQARRSGAQDATARVSTRRHVEVEVREHHIDRLQESTSRSLSVELYVDGRYSVHTTQNFDRAALVPFLDEAVALTRYLSPDPFRCLPDPERMRGVDPGDLQLRDPAYDALEPGDRIARAKAAESAALAAGGDALISVTTAASDTLSQVLLLNTQGFQGFLEGTRFAVSAEATVRDGDRGRPEDYAYASARHAADLPDAVRVGQEAVRRALGKVGQVKRASGTCDVLVENRTAGHLISALLDPLEAGAIQQKQSYLEAYLHKLVAAPLLTLVDDPFVVRGLASSPFDGEGLALQRRTLIDHGVLQSFLVDTYYGRKLGWAPNSGSVSNLRLEGGQGTREELLARLGTGLLVTDFIGGNANDTTGDFSYGLAGFWVEHGEVVHPVNEMNLSGNFLDFWTRLDAVGGDPFPYSSLAAPSLLFRGLQLSGK